MKASLKYRVCALSAFAALAVLAAPQKDSSSRMICGLPDADIDRGGVTFDFAAASARRFAMDVPDAENLVKGRRDGGAGFKTEITLPDDKGGDYALSCRYTLAVPGSYRWPARGNGCRLGFGTTSETVYFLLSGGDWMDFMRTVKVPAGTRKVSLEMVENKECSLSFRDLALVRKAIPEIEVDMTVHGSIDDTFAVSPGQPGLVMFTWRRTPAAKFGDAAQTARISLPKGVDFVDASIADAKTMSTKIAADGSSVTTFSLSKRIPETRHYWSQNGVMVRGADSLRPGSKIGEGSLAVFADGREIASMKMRFKAVEPVSAIKPKRYFNGFDFSSLSPIQFSNRAHQLEYVRWMSGCGADAAIAEATGRRDNDLFRECGFSRVLPRQNVAVNGYIFRGGWKDRPPAEIAHVPYPDRKDENLSRFGVCPQAVYGGLPWYREQIVPKLRSILAGADGMWSNWEPCHYTGCFCDKCRVLFAKFAGLDAEALKKGWPAEAVKKYKREIDEFHSIEHAKLVRAVDKTVRELTGGRKSMGFVPGIEWADISSCWRDENLAASYRPAAYAGDLEWIEPWGPYGYTWAAGEPYVYVKSRAMAMFWGAADLRAQVDADYPAGRRPKLMAYPHGVQGGWICQPEVVGIELDSCFFNRWEATMLYFFPLGCDARYWRFFAEATTRAAKYEDYVIDGVETTSRVAAECVPEFAAPASYGTRYVPKSANASMLQTRAFDLGGRRIVAVINFWEKGEAFFKLKSSGLKGRFRVIDEDGVAYVKDGSCDTWTAEELARGVDLAVGAMRTRVFEIVPIEESVSPSRRMTSGRLRAIYESRREELKKAADEDMRHEKANPTPPRDYMPMV